MGKEYLYKVGQVVNETLKIVEHIRVSNGKKYTQKGYVVKSLAFPDDKNDYEISENNLRKGTECAYLSGQRVCEEISLWSIREIRNNIIDIDEAKTVMPLSSKKILFKCSTAGCDNTKHLLVYNLVKQGYSCPNCSTGTSYPERYFTSYLTKKNIEHECQVRFDDLPGYIFDYKIMIDNKIYLVETHGIAHYDPNHPWYKKTNKSDEVKRKYAKSKEITFIELDCRKSEFTFIRDNINACEQLLSIKKEDEKAIIELIGVSSKYDTQKIIRLYEVEKLTTYQIGEKYNVHPNTVRNILVRNNIKLRKSGHPTRLIRCIETNIVYKNSTEAMRETGIKNDYITRCCRGTHKTAGGYHWEYITVETVA